MELVWKGVGQVVMGPDPLSKFYLGGRIDRLIRDTEFAIHETFPRDANTNPLFIVPTASARLRRNFFGLQNRAYRRPPLNGGVAEMPDQPRNGVPSFEIFSAMPGTRTVMNVDHLRGDLAVKPLEPRMHARTDVRPNWRKRERR
jgi:hypothetical protein